MRLKTGFELRELCGEKVVVAETSGDIDFCRVHRLNDTAADLWEALQGRDFTVADMTAWLCATYDVDAATAETDCRALLSQWTKAGLIEL